MQIIPQSLSTISLGIVSPSNTDTIPEYSFLPGYIKNIPYKYTDQPQSTITNNLNLVRSLESGNLQNFPDGLQLVDSILDKDLIITSGQSGLGVNLAYLDHNIETIIESPDNPEKRRPTTFINL